MSMDLSNFSDKNIYHCIAIVSRTLNTDIDLILENLSTYEPYKNIRTIVDRYEKSISTPRNISILSGPNTFIFFKDVVGKRILLLGEHHNIRSVCSESILKKPGAYEIQNWLVDICINNDISPTPCVDIFTETPYKHRLNLESCKPTNTLQNYENPLEAIACKLGKLKRSGNLPSNIRHHDIDIRKSGDAYDIFPTTEIYEIANKNNRNGSVIIGKPIYKIITSNYQAHKVVILSYLLGIDKSLYAATTYRSHVHMLYELYNEPFFKTDAEKLEIRYFATIDKEMSKIDTSIIDKKRFLYTLLGIYLQENMFVALMTIPIDLYFLVRLFVKFDKSKMSRGPHNCNNDTVQNAIVCVGDEHARFYRLFIEKYFNAIPSIVVVGKNQCVKLSNFDYFA